MNDFARVDNTHGPQNCAAAYSDADVSEDWSLSLTLESSPISLCRVFGLLGMLGVVPMRAHIVLLVDQSIEVTLHFASIRSSTADRLTRKIQQLTEIIDWTASTCLPSRLSCNEASPPDPK